VRRGPTAGGLLEAWFLEEGSLLFGWGAVVRLRTGLLERPLASRGQEESVVGACLRLHRKCIKTNLTCRQSFKTLLIGIYTGA
jgi:hypothetical protein